MDKLVTRLDLGFRRMVARFRCDTRGMSAIEFALIVPLLLLLFFGTIEISSGYAVDRKVSIAAQTLSDLASRSISLNDTEIANFRSILNAVMTPYSPTPLKATVTQVYIDPVTGAARAQWSKGTTPIAAGSPVLIPAALIGKDPQGKVLADQYLIFSQISYLYTPAVGHVMGKAGVTLTDTAYTRPRQSTCVYFAPSKDCTKT